MTEIQTQFEKAAAEVLELSKRPDDQTLLKLYGLYKQATEGNLKGKRPGFTDVKGRAKFDAWARYRGKSQDWAKGEYVRLVGLLQGKK